MARGLVPGISFFGADRLMAELGGDVAAACRATGVPAELFAHFDVPVSLDAGIDFLELAARSTGREDFGLLLAQRQDLSILGPIYAMMTMAGSVGEALAILAQQLQLHSSGLMLTLDRTGRGLRLDYSLHVFEAERDRQVMELGIGLAANFVRRYAAPDWVPADVQFRHAPPVGPTVHEAMFGATVTYHQDRNALSIDHATAARPVGQASAATRHILQRLMRERLAFEPDALTLRVEAAIRALLPYGADCSIDAVSTYLGASVRTLQRRLDDNGTAFGILREQVRNDLARKYLTQSSLNLAEIADVLGFAQPSAFSRAFSRANGMAPLRYRQRNRVRPMGVSATRDSFSRSRR